MNTINKENFQACFVNTTQEPKKKKHICYTVSKKSSFNEPDQWSLNAIEWWTYPHPDAPEDAVITIIVSVNKGIRFINDTQCILLDAAQRNITV